MPDFYITTDLMNSRIFIAQSVQVKESRAYFIEFDDLSAANQWLKKLIAKLEKTPLQSMSSYRLVETVFVNLGEIKGEVDIFRLKI